MANPSLLILAGDGIGPEVMQEVKRVGVDLGVRPLHDLPDVREVRAGIRHEGSPLLLSKLV